MTWNAEVKKDARMMGSWSWYRATPTSKPYPAWVYDSMGLAYVWLPDPHNAYRQTHRVDDCRGNFSGSWIGRNETQ